MRNSIKGIAVATMAATTMFAGAALAEYPEKPVSFIVPWPLGDLEDVLTRMIAEDFQANYGVPAAVVNKPGGGGGPFPGAIEVAMAPSDGYTIGSFVIAVPVIGHGIGIDELTPAKFDPLGIFLTYPFVLVTSGDAPYKTIQEMAEYAKATMASDRAQKLARETGASVYWQDAEASTVRINKDYDTLGVIGAMLE